MNWFIGINEKIRKVEEFMHVLVQFVWVIVILSCATGGTIGMIKLIKCFSHDEKDTPNPLNNWSPKEVPLSMQGFDEQEGKKKIFVLLTQHFDPFSRVFYWVSGRSYTHVSIGLEQYEHIYFSFNLKGFCIEHPPKRYRQHKKQKASKRALYQLEVSERVYCEIEKMLVGFVENADQYGYSYIGVILCLIHIPFKRKKKYFCSQFVAELLEQSKVLTFPKNPSLYLPNTIEKVLKAQDSICNLYEQDLCGGL